MLTIGKKDASGDREENGHRPSVTLDERDGELSCALSGIWTTRTVALVDEEMRNAGKKAGFQRISLDLSAVEKMDTAGAWLIERLISSNRKNGYDVTVGGESNVAAILLGAVSEATSRYGDSFSRNRSNILILSLIHI